VTARDADNEPDDADAAAADAGRQLMLLTSCRQLTTTARQHCTAATAAPANKRLLHMYTVRQKT